MTLQMAMLPYLYDAAVLLVADIHPLCVATLLRQLFAEGQ